MLAGNAVTIDSIVDGMDAFLLPRVADCMFYQHRYYAVRKDCVRVFRKL